MRILLVEGQLVASQMAMWREVSRQGVDLHIVGALRQVKDAGEWWRPEEPDWCPVHLIRSVSVPRRGQNWWYFPGLGKLIAELSPDLIHVTAEPWAVLVSQATRSGVPVVVHSADNIFTHGGRLTSALRSRRLQRLLPQLAGFVSWNSAGLELAHAFGLPTELPNLVVPAELPDPGSFIVDAATRIAVRDGFGLGSEDIAIGYFGRLEVEKGPLHLVRAFLEAGLRGSTLFIFGSGSLEHAIQEQSAQAGNRIRVMGPLPLGRVPATAASMDIIVVPSTTTPRVAEQFSRVAVEAMMARTAVIVSNCGALPEVVGSAAVVVPEGSDAELAVAIRQLGTNEAARRELVARGSERARAIYSPEAIAGKLQHLWSQVIQPR